MSEFHLSIVTPERMFFDGEADESLYAPFLGDVGILKGHAKYISALGTGALKIRFSDGEKIAALSGGFIKADREKTLILATTCEWKDEIDLERAKRAEEKAREMLQHAQSNAEHDLAELKLKRAVNRINIAE